MDFDQPFLFEIEEEEDIRVTEIPALVEESLTVGHDGPPGAVNIEALAHTRAKDNPHQMTLEEVIANCSEGAWVKVDDDSGVLAPTTPPVMPEDIQWPNPPDELVKSHTDSPSGYLSDFVEGSLRVSSNRLYLRGDEIKSPTKFMYFGTDETGTVGWHWLKRGV